MNNWRKQMGKDFSAFRDQGDSWKMTLRIIPASSIPAMLKAGDDGDFRAREMFMTITNWMKTADMAVDHGVYPCCGYCEDDLEHGDVYGWAVLMPEGEGIGMVAAYCERCMAREHDELMRDFMAGLEAETGVVSVTLQ